MGAGVPLDVPRLTRALAAPLAKDGFDPDQPRVPAGNPDGGQWTGEGGSGDIDAKPDLPRAAGPLPHDFRGDESIEGEMDLLRELVKRDMEENYPDSPLPPELTG